MAAHKPERKDAAKTRGRMKRKIRAVHTYSVMERGINKDRKKMVFGVISIK